MQDNTTNCERCGRPYTREAHDHRSKYCPECRSAKARRAANPEKWRRYRRKYYREHPEVTRRHYQNHREEIIAKAKARRAANPEKYRAMRKAHYRANASAIRRARKAYYRANPEKQKRYSNDYYHGQKAKLAHLREVVASTSAAPKVPSRGGRPRGISEETQGRLRLVAAIQRLGKSLRSMSKYVFRDTPKSAQSNTYRLASEHRNAIDSLTKTLTDAEAEAILQRAIRAA